MLAKFFTSKKKRKMFICGIGGIGTSGLAILARSCGYEVSGSNEEENKNTEKLKQLGFDVKIGHKPENLGDCDLFVYSSAVNLGVNVEAIEAKARQLEMYERGTMLAALMKNYYNIVVAGSHGKTTTTGLIGHMLKQLGKKPNILIGGVLNDCGTNCDIGGKKYFVVESDESDGSFLGMPANIGVITNIDPEHMEFYKNVDCLEYYFYRFAKKILDNNGYVIICIDDKIGANILRKIGKNKRIITYSAKDEMADFYYKNVRFQKNGITFDVVNKLNSQDIKDVFLNNLFGEINASNALASFAIGYILKHDSNEIAKNFSTFEGIQKRFTALGKVNNTMIFDDYAHNPQKIKAAIGSAKHYMKCNNLNGKLTIIFEPHRYTRVRDGIDLFVEDFKDCENIVILPIYASSEPPIEGITQEFIARKCKEVNEHIYTCSLDIEALKTILMEIDAFGDENLIVFMGAGRSSKLAHQFVEG